MFDVYLILISLAVVFIVSILNIVGKKNNPLHCGLFKFLKKSLMRNICFTNSKIKNKY